MTQIGPPVILTPAMVDPITDDQATPEAIDDAPMVSMPTLATPDEVDDPRTAPMSAGEQAAALATAMRPAPPVMPPAVAAQAPLQPAAPVLPEHLAVPPLAEVDVGGSDDFQVSGFFEKEGGGEHSYRWTGRCASVYLPGATPGAELTLTAGVGTRPASSPATVKATLSGTPLGGFTVGPGWSEYRLRLPQPLPPGPPVLRLDVPDWRPANVLQGSDDMRNLGVMIDRIGLQPPGGSEN